MSTENKKNHPMWQRLLATIVYFAVYGGAIFGGIAVVERVIYGAPEVDIRDLPPAQYQAAIDELIVKAKAEKRREAFELCMNLNMRKGEKEIKDCLSGIGE